MSMRDGLARVKRHQISRRRTSYTKTFMEESPHENAYFPTGQVLKFNVKSIVVNNTLCSVGSYLHRICNNNNDLKQGFLNF